jgi:two-component system, cell cycle sensor histidine kinase and response regulator CckA
MVPMANESRPPVVILVIDDDANVLDGVKRLLEDENCVVATASDPLEGIRLYAERWREIKLVLLDFSMPALRGDEVFVRLRRIHPGVRVLLMSAFNVETPLQRMLEDGLWGFIEKPFLPDELVDRVREAIHSR